MRASFAGMHSDLLVARIAQEHDAAQRRAERLRGVIPTLAAMLYEAGARRVVLFGSLAKGGVPHAESDIDLCVEGLDERALAAVVLELLERAGAEVDLVRWEAASPRLRRRISEWGEEVPRVTGRDR